MKLVFDYDGVAFKAACVAQEAQVKVKTPGGNEFIFKNKTEVYREL